MTATFVPARGGGDIQEREWKMRVSTKIANYIVRQFAGKTADEIQAMMIELQSLTQTNCWWLEYHLKAVLLDVAENELQLLKDKILQTEPAADSDVIEAEFVEGGK